MNFRKHEWLWTEVALAAMATTGCASSSNAIGGSVDAALDQSADSAKADVDMARDATVVDAAKEASSDDSSVDGSSDAAGGEAASIDASAMVDSGNSEAAPVCQPVDASTPDAGVVAAGAALVANRTCVLCHTSALSGGLDVPSMYGGYATSKNLTPDPATGLGCWTDEQIVTVILDGVTPEGDTLCVMPKWRTMPLQGKAPLTPEEAEQIVQYLRTIAPVHNAVRPTDCVALGYPKPDAATEASTPDASDAALE